MLFNDVMRPFPRRRLVKSRPCDGLFKTSFSRFSSVLQANAGLVPHIWPQPITFTSIPIQYSPSANHSILHSWVADNRSTNNKVNSSKKGDIDRGHHSSRAVWGSRQLGSWVRIHCWAWMDICADIVLVLSCERTGLLTGPSPIQCVYQMPIKKIPKPVKREELSCTGLSNTNVTRNKQEKRKYTNSKLDTSN
jgi:hypothetical protein